MVSNLLDLVIILLWTQSMQILLHSLHILEWSFSAVPLIIKSSKKMKNLVVWKMFFNSTSTRWRRIRSVLVRNHVAHSHPWHISSSPTTSTTFSGCYRGHSRLYFDAATFLGTTQCLKFVVRYNLLDLLFCSILLMYGCNAFDFVDLIFKTMIGSTQGVGNKYGNLKPKCK